MTILIHGDDTNSSYKHLQQLKEDYDGEKVTLVAKELTTVTLAESLQSTSLFETKKLLVVENPKGNKKLFDSLDVSEEFDLIIYETSKLTSAETASLQKKLPKLKIEEFKLSPTVFKFVDSLKPGNAKVIFPLWQTYIASEEPEIAFAMIVRQFRLLILAKDGFKFFPDDLKNLSPWQRTNLENQTKNFTKDELLASYKKLQKIDYQTKTGQTPLDLAASLELFLVSL